MKLPSSFMALSASCMFALPATAQVTCKASALGVAFGVHASRSGAFHDSTGHVSVTCTGAVGTTVSYSIHLGNGGAPSFFPRRMGGAATDLSYNLYVDAARSTVWGDGSAGTSVVADSYVLPSISMTRSYPIHARLFSQQGASVGSFGDSIIVSVSVR